MIEYILNKANDLVAWILKIMFDKEFFEAGLKESIGVAFIIGVIVSIIILFIYFL